MVDALESRHGTAKRSARLGSFSELEAVGGNRQMLVASEISPA